MASHSRGRRGGLNHFDQMPNSSFASCRGSRGRGREYSRNQYVNERDNNFESMETPTGYPREPMPPSPPEPKITPQPNIDEATRNWIYQLRHVFGLCKKSGGVTKMLHEYFACVPNPYISALIIITNCPGFNQVKSTSLTYIVIEELSNFMKDKKHFYASCLTPEVKTEAFFTITKQHNFSLIKLTFNVYEITKDSMLFVQPIRALINDGLYRAACECADFLRLHDQFTVEDFLVPLVFQDKMTIVEEFLSQSVPHQVALVKYFDKILSSPNISNEVYLISTRLKITNVKSAKLYYKPLCKMVARFVKLYNLKSDVCPILNEKKKGGALQFLLSKRYRENALGGISWREMIQEAVGNSEVLQTELVVALNSYGDVNEAAYWAIKYQLPSESLPYNVREYLSEGGGAQGGTEEEDWNTLDVRYYHLNLDISQIVMVDSENTMDEFLQRCFVGTEMIGIDAEWKPVFGTTSNELSLIQIATLQRVYILDVFALSHYHQFWTELGIRLFANHDILKLGFGLAGDVSMMKEKLPLGDVKMEGMGFLDLSLLWRRLTRDFDVDYPYPGDERSTSESLSKLVSLCCGKPLDKSEQFSNWERRPLRDAQKIYAAMDAYCLLDVYNELYTICAKQNIPISDICHEVMVSPNSTSKKSKKKEAKQNKEPINEGEIGPNKNPVDVSWLRVVCDTMLQGLGKQLRKCGVDAVILENSDRHDHCLSVAKKENRVILSRGQSYRNLSKNVPFGYCYNVRSDFVNDQMVEVLDYYNVVVKKDDIFSRCQSCNGDKFAKLTPSQLTAIKYGKKIASSTQNYDFDDDDDDDDDYTGFSDDSENLSDDGGGVSAAKVYTSCYRPTRTLVEDTQPNYGDGCQTSTGAHIKFESIPPDMYKKVSLFYICDQCGCVYWDGSHFTRFLEGRFPHLSNP